MWYAKLSHNNLKQTHTENQHSHTHPAAIFFHTKYSKWLEYAYQFIISLLLLVSWIIRINSSSSTPTCVTALLTADKTDESQKTKTEQTKRPGTFHHHRPLFITTATPWPNSQDVQILHVSWYLCGSQRGCVPLNHHLWDHHITCPWLPQ